MQKSQALHSHTHLMDMPAALMSRSSTSLPPINFGSPALPCTPPTHLMDMSAALTSHTALASNQTSGMSVSPYLRPVQGKASRGLKQSGG